LYAIFRTKKSPLSLIHVKMMIIYFFGIGSIQLFLIFGVYSEKSLGVLWVAVLFFSIALYGIWLYRKNARYSQKPG
jgi:hypothetical protein